MLIVLILSDYESIHTVRWINELVKRGHEVHLVSERRKKSDDYPYSRNVVLHFLPFCGRISRVLNVIFLAWIARKIKPDVVNAHYVSVYGTYARLAKLKGNYVLSARGSDVYEYPYRSKLHYHLVEKNLRYATRITSTSKVMAQQINRLLGDDGNRVEVVPFGVDINLFDPKRFEQRNEPSDGTICIGIVKSLKAIYAIDDFLQIIKALRCRLNYINATDGIRLRFCVSIYGDGPDRRRLEEIVKVFDLSDIVTFHGYLNNNDIPEALSTMDIFLITSIRESFGVAVIEAMAMELPIVASDAEGFIEVLENGKYGFIIENRNVDSFVEKLVELIMDESLRRSMGIESRRKVLRDYNFKNNVSDMESLYENSYYR